MIGFVRRGLFAASYECSLNQQNMVFKDAAGKLQFKFNGREFDFEIILDRYWISAVNTLVVITTWFLCHFSVIIITAQQ
jgi:hypothetical protein